MANVKLHKDMCMDRFIGTYYRKDELVAFCKQEGLASSGGKIELTNRICKYLETGEKEKTQRVSKKKVQCIQDIELTTTIEADFVCTQTHRAFFEAQIGPSFLFRVSFQKWLKTNTGKTYQEAIDAYYEIEKRRKTEKKSIDPQFEYNTYIRDFYQDNKGKALVDAIVCWKYKRGKQGQHRYEKEDLIALQKKEERSE